MSEDRSNGFGHTPGLRRVLTGKGGVQVGGERSNRILQLFVGEGVLTEKEGNSQTHSQDAPIFPPQVRPKDLTISDHFPPVSDLSLAPLLAGQC